MNLLSTVEHLFTLLPRSPTPFPETTSPLPATSAMFGNQPVTHQQLTEKLQTLARGDVKHLLEPLLAAAEWIESARPDRDSHFLTDAAVRDTVFMGSKWKAGWALVLGNKDAPELVDELKKRGFIVFTDRPGIEDTRFIGDRDTSPVYFLQLMVRYAMTWGGIRPGDPHEMGHFLERDMPGFIIITEELPDLKYLVTLGLMKLGAPAVVPSSFPFPYGNRVVAESLDDILDRGCRFENLRQRFFNDEILSLPDFCNPAFAQEKFDVARTLGGTPDSFFCVRPAQSVTPGCSVKGTPDRDVGILIEIAEQRFTDDVALTVETSTVKALSYFPCVKGYDRKGSLTIDLAADAKFEPDKIAETLRAQVRLHYPRIKNIAVRIIFGHAACSDLAPGIRSYKVKRREFVDSMTEENTSQYCVCTECRPFSLVHTCIVTPDRTPMCSSRTYASIKAAALFGNTWDPFKRPSEKNLDLRTVFDKGRTIDAQRGEYEGANLIYSKMTGGKLSRVFLHSVRDFPHTSCGCFQTLAFWMPEVRGIGVMSRGSGAVTPDGRTWDMLANAAGGKQTPGIMGVSVAYIRSRHFLKGDGGIANLVWVGSVLLAKITDRLPQGHTVATEREVDSIAQLQEFINHRLPRDAQ